ncbi:MAG: hypothetical protein ACO39X_07585, partial [Candidatus Nanopelagicaceae bacterium]
MPLPEYDYTTTLLEDVFEPVIDPYCPVYVIDFKVAAHFINNYSEAAVDVASGSEEELRKIVRAMWAYRLNRGPDMLEPMPFVGLVADDLKGQLPADFSEASASGKGYWRHIEAHKLDMAEYKGGRGEKTEFFDLIQDEGYKYVSAPGSTFHYFAKEFFEADDIAGHVCRLKRKSRKNSKLAKRQIFLGTLDGDWQGLVSDSHGIIWANTGPWLPRLRSEREVCDYYLRKEGMHITSARGCYDFKVEYGDLGDNLYPGTPLRFFDLYDEDTAWRFTEDDTKRLLKVLNSTAPSNRPDHMESARMYLLRKGLFLPEIPATWHEDKSLYFSRAAKSRLENSHPELVGRNRTLCMEKVSDIEIFEKCKDLALKDFETHS